MYSDKEWQDLQLGFLIDNNFYTRYCIDKYGPGRQANIEEQRKRIDAITSSDEKEKSKELRKKKEKLEEELTPKRGVETMFRSIYRNHISLSAIADRKANMMISINTIVMSVIISFVGSGFIISANTQFQHYKFAIPIGILLLTCLISVVFSIMSARPNVTNKDASMEKIREKKSSLLFFGNFTSLKLETFVEELNNLMKAKDLLYDNMSIDIYHLGVVLKRKYQLLRVSYTIFMIGFILCVLSFMIVMGIAYSSKP
jgi:hypothetical protein